jgi:hypothetical protein
MHGQKHARKRVIRNEEERTNGTKIRKGGGKKIYLYDMITVVMSSLLSLMTAKSSRAFCLFEQDGSYALHTRIFIRAGAAHAASAMCLQVHLFTESGAFIASPIARQNA